MSHNGTLTLTIKTEQPDAVCAVQNTLELFRSWTPILKSALELENPPAALRSMLLRCQTELAETIADCEPSSLS